jgi:hypothetical protein
VNTPATPPAQHAGLSERITREGQMVISQVDLDPIIQLLDTMPTALVIGELDAILQALEGTDPVRSRKRVGVVGRLLGRDLVAQADPDPIDSRVRLHLARANGHARDLQAHVQHLEVAWKSLYQHHASLDAAIRRAEAILSEYQEAAAAAGQAEDAAHRRLGYVRAVADSWRNTCAQLDNAVRYGCLVLDRHVQVRDVLVPLWRQQAGAAALNRTFRDSGVLQLESLHLEARHGLAALQTSILSHTNHHPAPADRESSP